MFLGTQLTILAMPRVETQESPPPPKKKKKKKKRKEKKVNKNIKPRSVTYRFLLMNCSTTIYKLVHICLALYLPLQYDQSHYSRRVRCPWTVYYDVDYQIIFTARQMPRVETRGSGNKKKSKQTNLSKKCLNCSVSQCAVSMNYSTTICKIMMSPAKQFTVPHRLSQSP